MGAESISQPNEGSDGFWLILVPQLLLDLPVQKVDWHVMVRFQSAEDHSGLVEVQVFEFVRDFFTFCGPKDLRDSS